MLLEIEPIVGTSYGKEKTILEMKIELDEIIKSNIIMIEVLQ